MTREMQIIVEPSTFNCLNMGDVAMLQVAISRLSALWPAASIHVFTNDPAALALHCSEVEPLTHTGRKLWLGDQGLLGRLHQYVPGSTSRQLARLKRTLAYRWPGLLEAAFWLKGNLFKTEVNEIQAFVETVRKADLVIMSGNATFTDKAKSQANLALNTLEMAIRWGLPTALFSQGFGPLYDPELISRLKGILPSVNLIAVREGRAGPRLLESLGVDQGQVVTTGDDAIELAYTSRPTELGCGLGVNLRVAGSSDVDASFIQVIRPILQTFARKYAIPLIPVPIALHQFAQDQEVIRQLLAGYDNCSDGGQSLNTPYKVIQQVGRCRIVVTGAYHAAVFALAQGIPAVCLAYNAYYTDKYLGLAEQFGAGCEVVFMNNRNLPEYLNHALDKAWHLADQVRQPLQEAAASQVELSRIAYRRVAELVEAS